MTNAIFWYTGLIIWAVIGAAFAITALVCFIVGAAQAYRLGRQWNAIWQFCYMTPEERGAFNTSTSHANYTDEQRASFMRLIDTHRAKLAMLSRGPIMRWLSCGGRYEMSDGTTVKCISSGSGDYGETAYRCEVRDEASNYKYTIRADGVCVENPILRVVRRLDVSKEGGEWLN